MSRRYNGVPDRQQVETADYAQPNNSPVAFYVLWKNLDGISQKLLTDSLRFTEEDGIVIRSVYAEVPPRVEYSLSKPGASMRPIIKSMDVWGTDYRSRTESTSE